MWNMQAHARMHERRARVANAINRSQSMHREVPLRHDVARLRPLAVNAAIVCFFIMGPAHMFALWSGVTIHLAIFWFLLILSMYAGIHTMDGARTQKPGRLFRAAFVCLFVAVWVILNLFVSPFTNISLMYEFSEEVVQDDGNETGAGSEGKEPIAGAETANNTAIGLGVEVSPHDMIIRAFMPSMIIIIPMLYCAVLSIMLGRALRRNQRILRTLIENRLAAAGLSPEEIRSNGTSLGVATLLEMMMDAARAQNATTAIAPGLPSSVINALPTHKVEGSPITSKNNRRKSSETGSDSDDSDDDVAAVAEVDEDLDICVICQDDLTPGKEVTTLPCNHEFCTKCINVWFQRATTCPMCMHDLKNPDMEQGGSAGDHTAAATNGMVPDTTDVEMVNIRNGSLNGSLTGSIDNGLSRNGYIDVGGSNRTIGTGESYTPMSSSMYEPSRMPASIATFRVSPASESTSTSTPTSISTSTTTSTFTPASASTFSPEIATQSTDPNQHNDVV